LLKLIFCLQFQREHEPKLLSSSGYSDWDKAIA
jgi:hypothetical protein